MGRGSRGSFLWLVRRFSNVDHFLRTVRSRRNERVILALHIGFSPWLRRDTFSIWFIRVSLKKDGLRRRGSLVKSPRSGQSSSHQASMAQRVWSVNVGHVDGLQLPSCHRCTCTIWWCEHVEWDLACFSHMVLDCEPGDREACAGRLRRLVCWYNPWLCVVCFSVFFSQEEFKLFGHSRGECYLRD